MSPRKTTLSQETIAAGICQLLLHGGNSQTAETGVRLAERDTLRAVLVHLVNTGDGDRLITDLLELPDEGRALRAILALAMHLIECHKPETQ